MSCYFHGTYGEPCEACAADRGLGLRPGTLVEVDGEVPLVPWRPPRNLHRLRAQERARLSAQKKEELCSSG